MDITKQPKRPSINMADLKPTKRLEVKTLFKYITEDETKNYRITFLKNLTTISKTAKWKEYLDFIQTNLSGDITSFSHEHRNYIDNMIKEIEEKRETETTAS